MTQTLAPLHRLVWISLCAALVGAGAFMVVPIGPVPVSMQPLFVFLAGFLLGARGGALSLALYLAVGLMGLPVFAGGRSGPAHLLGPTGGYLAGFLVAAAVCGMARVRNEVSWPRGLGFGFAAVLLVYALGAAWLKRSLGLDWEKVLAAGVLPFIPWDLAKLALAVACARFLSRCRLGPCQP